MRWLEERYAENRDEVLGLLAYHWLAAGNAEDEAVALPDARRRPRPRSNGRSTRRSATTAALLPLLERRGADQEIALVLLKLAIALHTSLRFAEANETYQRAFRYWKPPDSRDADRDAAHERQLRAASLRPARRGLLAGHQPLHAALRPARRGMAGPDDRPARSRSAGRSRTTGSATSSTSARAALVGRRAADRPRLGSSASGACSTPSGPDPRRRSTSCSRTARTTSSATMTTPRRSACERSTTGPSSSGSSRLPRTS